MTGPHEHALHDTTIANAGLLPDGAVGIDAGLTLTKSVRAEGSTIVCVSRETDGGAPLPREARRVGVTGARGQSAAAARAGLVISQEIDAATRGVVALLKSEERLPEAPFVVALLGTGTAFAAVRDVARPSAAHLGGTPLGGGSFAGIAARVEPSLTYEEMIAAAERGDRRGADVMVSEAYPEGIGRIGPDLTAAHLSKNGASLDDFLAGLLNLHGENIAQIAASRAIIAQARSIVLAGGFAHNNPSLVQSITSMASLFGVDVHVAPAPGYAGALGAALIAAESALRGE